MDIQTHGNLVQWNPHFHAICTDGCFDTQGAFYPLPKISSQRLAQIFAAKVLKMLIKEKALSQKTADMILSWKHSGFSVHTDTRLKAEDKKGLSRLAEYTVKQYCFAVLCARLFQIKTSLFTKMRIK